MNSVELGPWWLFFSHFTQNSYWHWAQIALLMFTSSLTVGDKHSGFGQYAISSIVSSVLYLGSQIRLLAKYGHWFPILWNWSRSLLILWHKKPSLSSKHISHSKSPCWKLFEINASFKDPRTARFCHRWFNPNPETFFPWGLKFNRWIVWNSDSECLSRTMDTWLGISPEFLQLQLSQRPYRARYI